MAIKIKYKDPKSTDFGINDIVINVREGTIFYKSEKGLFKLQGDNLDSVEDLISFGESSISASKGFFSTPKLPNLKIEGKNSLFRFRVSKPTLEIGGHILPSPTPAPSYDLGSPNSPFRDLYLSPSSIKFIKTRGGVGGSRIGSTFIIGSYRKETIPEEEETLTQENVTALKAGRSIVSVSKKVAAAGNVESVDGVTNYIRPEVIYHPTDDETAILHKANSVGRLSYRTPGGDPFDIHCDGGSNDTIRFGSTTTNATEIKLHGTISASIDGGSW